MTERVSRWTRSLADYAFANPPYRLRTAPFSASGRGKKAQRASLLVVEFANVMLGVKLDPQLGDQIELGFEEVDVVFLVLHQLLEQVAADVVLDRLAVRRRLLVKRARAQFRLQVTVEYLLHRLAAMQRVEHLHIGKALEEDDAHREAIGVAHFLDRLLAPFFRQRLEAPVVQQTVMDPVLTDGGQLAPEPPIQILDDLRIALHYRLLRLIRGNGSGVSATRARSETLQKGLK